MCVFSKVLLPRQLRQQLQAGSAAAHWLRQTRPSLVPAAAAADSTLKVLCLHRLDLQLPFCNNNKPSYVSSKSVVCQRVSVPGFSGVAFFCESWLIVLKVLAVLCRIDALCVCGRTYPCAALNTCFCFCFIDATVIVLSSDNVHPTMSLGSILFLSPAIHLLPIP